MVISPWDGGTRLYEYALDVRGAMHELVAANVANEETPGYKALHLPFKEALASALNGEGPLGPRVTHPRHFPVIHSEDRVFLHLTTPVIGSGPDGNTVSLEKQMTLMAENSFLYMALAQFLSGRFNAWGAAIDEGRR